MIARELMALGGGVLKPRDADEKVLQLTEREQELNDARILRYSQLAQRSRLIAELAGGNAESIVVPSSSDDELVSADARRRIIADQVSLFKVHQDVIADQTRSLREERASY